MSKLAQIIKLYLFTVFLLCTVIVVQGQDTYLDRFNTVSYNNNNGTNNYAANWNEVNDGTDSPTAGTIRIVSNQLRFRQLTGQYILRQLDLSGSSSAILTFEYDTSNIGNEILTLWMITDTNNFVLIGNIPSNAINTVTYTVPANQRSEFSGLAFSTGSGNWDAGEEAFIDDVQFSVSYNPEEQPRPYEERESVNVQGNFRMRGNTNIECISDCPGSPDTNNPPAVMGYADIDSDGSTVNSSSSTMTLPAGATVEYAGLYWGGLYESSRSGITNPPGTLDMDEVKLRTPAGAGYTTITADVRNMERTAQRSLGHIYGLCRCHRPSTGRRKWRLFCGRYSLGDR